MVILNFQSFGQFSFIKTTTSGVFEAGFIRIIIIIILQRHSDLHNNCFVNPFWCIAGKFHYKKQLENLMSVKGLNNKNTFYVVVCLIIAWLAGQLHMQHIKSSKQTKVVCYSVIMV